MKAFSCWIAIGVCALAAVLFVPCDLGAAESAPFEPRPFILIEDPSATNLPVTLEEPTARGLISPLYWMRLRIDSNAADQNVPTIAGAATFKFEIEKSFGQVFWAHSNPKFVEANFHSHWIPERDRPRSGEAPPNFNFNIGYQF